jgi:glycosyltransferase involved in cell wall biosynthesis
MLDQITPVILTYNEAPNIARTLEPLRWAREIIIVDSQSTDETLDLITRSPHARVFQRVFDCFADQWTFALTETGITTEWVLALDADYLLTPEFVAELKTLTSSPGVDGYQARFVYCVYGHPLRGSAYPPVTVLYRREEASYRQDGHAHRVELKGKVETLSSPILHDDRKSLSHWLRVQDGYMRIESRKLRETGWKQLGWADRIRKMGVVAPIAILFYCLFVKGAILDGRPGLYYTFQRLLAELLLSLYLIDRKRIVNCEGIANCELRIADSASKSEEIANCELRIAKGLRIADSASKSNLRVNSRD